MSMEAPFEFWTDYQLLCFIERCKIGGQLQYDRWTQANAQGELLSRMLMGKTIPCPGYEGKRDGP